MWPLTMHRVKEALQKLKNDLPNIAIMEEGRNDKETSVVLMEQGVFYGMGYIEKGLNIPERQQLKEYLTPYPENEMIRSLILRHAEKYPEKTLIFK